MRVEFRRMLPSDLHRLDLQESQALFGPLLEKPEYAEQLAACPVARACLVDGAVAGLAGIAAAPDAPHLGIAWALVARAVPRRAWPAITADVRRCLLHALDEFAAIVAEVSAVHAEGARWAEKLGFVFTGFRLCRYAGDNPLPALQFTLTDPPGYGLTPAHRAALAQCARVQAAWLRLPVGTDPAAIIAAAKVSRQNREAA